MCNFKMLIPWALNLNIFQGCSYRSRRSLITVSCLIDSNFLKQYLMCNWIRRSSPEAHYSHSSIGVYTIYTVTKSIRLQRHLFELHKLLVYTVPILRTKLLAFCNIHIQRPSLNYILTKINYTTDSKIHHVSYYF